MLPGSGLHSSKERQRYSLGRGAITNTDMMTVGRGGYPGGKPGMSQGQYRIEVFLYAVLSSPMVLSFECACLQPSHIRNTSCPDTGIP